MLKQFLDFVLKPHLSLKNFEKVFANKRLSLKGSWWVHFTQSEKAFIHNKKNVEITNFFFFNYSAECTQSTHIYRSVKTCTKNNVK